MFLLPCKHTRLSIFSRPHIHMSGLFLLRGLCTILRTAAGGQNKIEDFDVPEYGNNFHWLQQQQPPEAIDDDDDADAAASPGNSNYVCYYDAASLYPSSGEFSFSLPFLPQFSPIEVLAQPPHPQDPPNLPALRAGAGP